MQVDGKGKTSLENIKAIEKLLSDFSEENGDLIDAFYYCYHHPEGIVPGYSKHCRCRKPGTLFLEEAIINFSLDARRCWFIGDRDTDVKCGKSVGFYTIKIENKHSADKSGLEEPDFFADNLLDATIKLINIKHEMNI